MSSLPGLDGWQVIERIREFSRVPILMVTARSSEADKIRGLKLGADDYITKPLSFPELVGAGRGGAAAGVDRDARIGRAGCSIATSSSTSTSTGPACAARRSA